MLDLATVKVCFIAGTLAKGGAEQQLYHILRRLRSRGNHPHLLCLTRGEYWEGPIRDLGIPVTWVGQHEGRLRRLKQVMEAVRTLAPDIVQSQHFYTNIYAAVAARFHGAREIGAIRIDGFGEVKTHGAILGRLSMRVPRCMAANSRVALRAAEALGVAPERTFFLPNVVDVTQFRPHEARTGGPVTLLTVGRLVRQKRIDRFLRVLKRVQHGTTQPVRGVIVGAGTLRASLEAQAEDLGLLPDIVTFRGAVAEMAPVYQAADIFVMTSDREGTPNVVLEAMASGLPVVSTRVGGISDLIAHEKTGFLFDPADETGMEQALQRLIYSAEQRFTIGRQARRYIEETHAPERLSDVLADLYAWALEGSAAGSAFSPHPPT